MSGAAGQEPLRPTPPRTSVPAPRPPRAKLPLRARVAALGAPELVVLAASIGITLAAWAATVFSVRPELGTFTLTLLVVNGAASLVQLLLLTVVRPHGTLRERVGFAAALEASYSNGWVLYLPVLVYAVVFLAATPYGMPTESFSADLGVLQIVLLWVVLDLVAVQGALALIAVLLLPIGLVVASVLPDRGSAPDRVARFASRTELVTIALILLDSVAIGFAVPWATGGFHGDSTYAAGVDAFAAVARGQGAPLPTVVIALLVALLVVLVVVNRRAAARHRAEFAQGEQPPPVAR